MMDTFHAIRTLRSVRKFEPRPVPDEIILRVLNAGRLSGSAKNTQPWQFILIKDRALMEALSRCGKYAQHLKGAAFAIVLLTDRDASYDAGRCSQNMMLAAWNDGVGSCIATMHQAEDAKQVLGVPAEYKLQQVISFGYPTEEYKEPPRKGGRELLDKMLHYERWESHK